MQDYKKLLGQRIKQIRKSQNLTQGQLAELIDVEIPSISYIETGKFAPSTETLLKLSKALSVKPWEFYYFENLSSKEMFDKIVDHTKDNPKLIKMLYHFILSISHLL